MDNERWENIQRIFHEAADLPLAEQHAFLTVACGSDDALLADVLALLKEDARADSLLDHAVAQVAQNVLIVSASPSLLPGELGPYKIKKVLGEGGMGVVYLAEREDLKSLVAIKILRDAWLSPARRERFASEQRMLAQLNHPSIARLYDADTLADGTPCFIMEYVEGIPLTDYCNKYQCSIERRMQLFRAVCEAVQYAHQHAVIHRDLKPSNILVKNDGSVRLLDFGIAKQIDSLDATVNQTLTGLRLMTPAYAAPEQVRGDRVGIHTDVYSLGVILYELLSGQLPFDLVNLTPGEAATIIAGHEPGKPSAVTRKNRSLPGSISGGPPLTKSAWADLDVLCLTGMHKDPLRRYSSVEALIRDVDHYLNAQPLEARADSVRYRTAKFVRRHRNAVAVAAFVFLLIIGMAASFTVRLAKARDAAMTEAARAQRVQQFMTNLFQGGDPSAGPQNNLTVITLLDRGLQEAQSLSSEPDIQAELYETLADLFENLGKLDQANTALNSALAIRKSLFGPNSPEVGETLVALGLLRDDQAQLPEAERLVREGLEIEKRKLAPHHPAIAKATTALGKVLEDRGSYDSAIAILKESLRLQSGKEPVTPELASSLYELANCQFYAGHYDEAEALNQRLLPIIRRIYGDRHPRVADVLINLGAIRHDLGRYTEAEPLERQALEIVQGWYGKDNPETAADLTILARTLVFEGRFDEATSLLEQSLEIKERVYGKIHPGVASSLNELGNVAMQQERHDAAAKYFNRMLDIYHAIYGQHHYLLGIALSNLAGAQAAKHEWGRAETLFRQAIQIFTETQSASHINTGIARTKLGRTLLRERRYAEAETESRNGYEILFKQMNPGARWLVSVRKDLIEEYTALKQIDNAERFRDELTSLDVKALNSSGKNR
jgi:serine/threonine-protein kinase